MYIPSISEYLNTQLKTSRRIEEACAMGCEDINEDEITRAEYDAADTNYISMREAEIEQNKYHVRRELGTQGRYHD